MLWLKTIDESVRTFAQAYPLSQSVARLGEGKDECLCERVEVEITRMRRNHGGFW